MAKHGPWGSIDFNHESELMVTPDEAMLEEFLDKYRNLPVSLGVARLYDAADKTERMFSVVHDQLNQLFELLNSKARGNGHFNAHESRQLLRLTEDIDEIGKVLDIAADGLELGERYRVTLDTCRGFLEYKEGSTIPEGFTVELVKYEPVFHRSDRKVRAKSRPETFDLHMVASGSYAHVYRYVDREYDETFAVKRAKKGSSDQELLRFRQEFDVMKSVRSPYIIQVHRFDEEKQQYSMEYCESTLRSFVESENSTLTFATRRRMALQFLYGMQHVHKQKHLH